MDKKRQAFIAAGFAWLLAAAAHAGVEDVIGRARTAHGDFSKVTAIEFDGALRAGGMAGELTATEDVRTGRSVSRYTLGPVTGGDGYDGTASWSQSAGGEVVVADGEQAIADARTDAWLARRAFLDAKSATYEPPTAKTHEGRAYSVIRATPPQGSPVELWFDDATGLLARLVEQRGQDTVTTTLADYRAVDGVKLPFSIDQHPGEDRNRVEIAWQDVALKASVDDALFAKPETPDTVTFTDGSRSATLPIEFHNNHLFIDAKIDGQPVKLLVDTGGANILTPAAAKRLGLAPEGKLAARGVGGSVDMGFANAKSLAMGAIEVAKPVFYVLDLGALPDVEGFDFDGLVGYEVFHRFGVTIDYDALKLTLAEPDAFTPPANATAVPFELDDNIPLVSGSIDGVPARISVDTGSRSSLTTHAPFNRDQKLVEKYDAKFEAVTGWGVGGPLKSSPVRFKEVKIGDVTVASVVGDLFTGTKGSFADSRTDANVGGELLARFTVAFDYEKRRMYLAPGKGYAEPDRYDRLGAWLMRDGDRIRIAALTPTGAAEAAGLAVDDRIVAIDGEEVGRRTLAEWRRHLRETAAGTKVSLAIERAGEPRTVGVVLKELVP